MGLELSGIDNKTFASNRSRCRFCGMPAPNSARVNNLYVCASCKAEHKATKELPCARCGRILTVKTNNQIPPNQLCGDCKSIAYKPNILPQKFVPPMEARPRQVRYKVKGIVERLTQGHFYNIFARGHKPVKRYFCTCGYEYTQTKSWEEVTGYWRVRHAIDVWATRAKQADAEFPDHIHL